jgi:hypothetical protein
MRKTEVSNEHPRTFPKDDLPLKKVRKSMSNSVQCREVEKSKGSGLGVKYRVNRQLISRA